MKWRRIWGRIGAIDDMCVGLVGHETRLGDLTALSLLSHALRTLIELSVQLNSFDFTSS